MKFGTASRILLSHRSVFLTAALCDPTVNKCNSPVIGLKEVMEQKISSDHRTNKETILNNSCTPNSDFTSDYHSFSGNLNTMSEPQPFDNSGYEESSNQNVYLLDRNGKNSCSWICGDRFGR
ncbi:hypothetical protein C5167_044596 [Papaver somniferum]|uniref:Uncharacterized protein n=1 Tax=Papaver somniferum TaxID=3469 RepID=A0A4Y7LCW0_PAPSO|nr:hypothetical protein C5167_044596 [Papaver somniferum]